MNEHPGHLVGIIGGAVAGSEAAYQLTKRGIRVVVFEQGPLPYGKIEDGLPMWHARLRDQEERKIDEKLGRPLVSFVPNAKLGRELDFGDVVRNWGFAAVLLATGAWRDRALPVPDIDAFVGRGLYYQNPMLAWFNHKHDPGYQGEAFELRDGAIVIGGGLASLDTAKIVMLETTREALARRGHESNVFKLEKEGIAQTLERLGLTMRALGLKGCTLYYRRRGVDMPVAVMPAGADDQRRAQVESLREKILGNFRSKYLFRLKECRVPVDKIVEERRLAGLVFQETELVGAGVVTKPGSEYAVKAPLVISSIGSLPELISGIPMRAELYHVEDEATGRVAGYDRVFALGNSVTGRGNIRESLAHGREVSEQVAAQLLAWRAEDYKALLDSAAHQARAQAGRIADVVAGSATPSAAEIRSTLGRVQEVQRRAGYDGDYRKWVADHLPARLEHMLGEK